MAKKKAKKKTSKATNTAKYPKYSLEKSLRIPRAVMEQNAGKPCSDKDAAGYLGVKHTSGPFQAELGSAVKYGLLNRAGGVVELTEISKKILKPVTAKDINDGLRSAITAAPNISDVYEHYRGENLPDEPFFSNALTSNFNIPAEKSQEFKEVFINSLRYANLIEEHDGKIRLLDAISTTRDDDKDSKSTRLKKLEKEVTISDDDTCFVMMPFAPPIGNYYELIYEPAITKAGLKPVRADDDIFKTGKIIEQIWSGINSATVLVAELTGRNSNVFYELGLAHAKSKPVVLIASSEADVPFDIRHIRVIYYDVNDPFWGEKLIEKVAENILSAIKNPEEATFSGSLGKASK